MIPAAVEHVRPSSLEEALEALADSDAKVLSGGQSLLPVMKLRIVRPSVLVDIGRLELGGVETRENEVRVGALATWGELEVAPGLEEPSLAAIAECAAEIGDLQVRNWGTLGGSLAHADPASDMPAVALALGAKLVLRTRDGERTLSADEFFLGPFTTALAPGELITEVVFPVVEGSGSAYVKVEHPASGFALAGAAARVTRDGKTRVAVTGVGARPFLLSEDMDPLDAVGEAEIYGDRFAPTEYRRHLAGIVVRRALDRARERSEEKT
ncbi:MAG: xanthine dehydrogenase family protein subunit M [Actinomycetota bacterium]|nr:xanthine dehydrogenase family protein subunit M [Actinomycetota bacterium]